MFIIKGKTEIVFVNNSSDVGYITVTKEKISIVYNGGLVKTVDVKPEEYEENIKNIQRGFGVERG